ncbi:MAG: hypothetical protein FWD05_01145 [Oscillospiraceae bacterium]|nr:hypothetical protein [Oscillospiraceae bacterium]
MRIKLIVATEDINYSKQISDNISEFHADAIEISISNSAKGVQEMLSKRNYDVALADTLLINDINTDSVNMPLLLCSENDCFTNIPEGVGIINKHQRISSIVAVVFEQYAKISKGRNINSGTTNITTVWSPAGGVGKTSIAIAYALSQVVDGKNVFYLNLEDFSSASTYLSESGKSISSVFELLENHDGNINMLIQGIRCHDKGIAYLCAPDNFEDVSILSSENINELIVACAELSDELIIDLPCTYDVRTKKAFELASKVLIVTDGSTTADAKLTQFVSQSNAFENIRSKITFVGNKDAVIDKPFVESIISLPFVQSHNENVVCETLSKFDCWK